MLDGFGGSGMTGVAAQWCGTAPAAYRHELETEWKKQGKAAPRWGARRVVLNDLSPAATFIAANYNLPFDVERSPRQESSCSKKSSKNLGGCTKPAHTMEKLRAELSTQFGVRYSRVLMCWRNCISSMKRLMRKANALRTLFTCPHCGAKQRRSRWIWLSNRFSTHQHGKTEKRPKRVPVLHSTIRSARQTIQERRLTSKT